MNNLRSSFLSLWLLLFIVGTLSGQTYKIDSLRTLIEKNIDADTLKVNRINELAFELYNRDANKALSLAEESMQMATTLKFHKGKANSLWITGLIRMTKNKEEGYEYFHKALKIAEVIEYNTGICNYLIAIGNISGSLGRLQESNEAHIRALKVAENIGDQSLIQKCRINLARKKMSAGNYPEAIKALQQVVSTAQQMNDTLLMARAYSNLATANMKQGNTATGLNYYLQSLDYNEKIHDRNGVMLSLINIASAQAQHNDRESAIKTINKALSMADKPQDSIRISLCYTVLGNIYSRVDKEKALFFLHKVYAMKYCHDAGQQVANLVNMGSIYLSLKEMQAAEKYLFEALELAQSRDIKSSCASVYEKLSEFFFSKQDYVQAHTYAQKTIDLAGEIGHKVLLISGYKLMSDVYAAKDDYKTAYTHYVRHKELNDSVYNEKNLQKIAILESEYAFSKEREDFKQKKAEIDLLANNQKQTIRFLAVISVLVILIAILLFRWGRLKKRILSLQIENISQELDINRKDNAVAQLKLVQKAERDAQTVKMLDTIVDSVQGADKQSIRGLIGNYKHEEISSNWEEFEALFTQLNAVFCERLNKHYPTLTPNERRLCIFMKLGMTNKDIAQITFQTEEALKKSRLRLRRKLGIERSVNLLSFIQSI